MNLVIARNYHQFRYFNNVINFARRLDMRYFYNDSCYFGMGQDSTVILIGYPSNVYLQEVWFYRAEPYFRDHCIPVQEFFLTPHDWSKQGFTYAYPIDADTNISRRFRAVNPDMAWTYPDDVAFIIQALKTIYSVEGSDGLRKIAPLFGS